jgi:hypothetical protein
MLDTETNNSELMPINIGRLLTMGGASILLCVSLFLSVFTPFPIGLISILHGRKIAIIVASISFSVFYLLVTFFIGDFFFLAFYTFCLLIGILLGELITRRINPIKGIFALGSMIILLGSMAGFSYVQSQDKSVKELLTIEFEKMKPIFDEQKAKIKESGSTETLEVEAMLSDPKLIADEMIKTVPSFFIVSIFIILWANMFMLLKSNRMMNKLSEHQFSEFDLLKFKVPEQFIFVVIFGLVLALLGDNLGKWYPEVGMTILKTIGIFYFFQGFGIYLAFLNRFNVKGFIRSVLVVLTVLSAAYIIALIGVFDMFVDFNKLLQKKEN